jgi:hypothetical protein
MTRLSTACQSLARLDARIAAEVEGQRKSWLSTYRNHWWGEVINDVDMVMETMSFGPISYSFDGHPFMTPDRSIANITDRAGTRAMYDGVVALGVRMAGPFDDERVLFDEHGIVIACILSAVYPGIFLGKHSEPVDPDGIYLIRWPNVTLIRFDAEGLMKGEDIINGAPIRVQQVDRRQVDMLVAGPLPTA